MRRLVNRLARAHSAAARLTPVSIVSPSAPHRIVVLAGGVGGSRFVRGALHAYPGAEVTVIVNTADDITLHGLRICPDLDTVMYTLGGGIDPERGWGRAAETWSAREELEAYGAQAGWFGLGDRDIATHLVRTEALNAGYPLSEVTRALAKRWLPPELGVRLLPMSDERVETHIAITDPSQPSGRRTVHFQEYWVGLHAEPDALAVVQTGLDAAEPAPGVLEAINDADLVLIAPSNPVVSIGPILAVAGIRTAVQRTAAPVVGFSGIIGAGPVLGMAHRLLPAIGVAVSALGVGRHYGSRRAGGVLDGFAVDTVDADTAAALSAGGLPTVATDLLMTEPAATAAFIAQTVAHVDRATVPSPDTRSSARSQP